MNERILTLINDFKRNKKLSSFDEAATKQAVILRILNALGWDPFNVDEVCPEYSVSGKRVDYALKYNGRNKVFIEVKKVDEDLEKHQEQLLSYSFQEGVKLAVLTNGISWWFYLPLREGNWEQRKFYTIEMYDQESGDIAEKFESFLSKENVVSDKAIENAENLYKSKQKLHLIEETLPKAWEKIITEPDEFLVELLAEITEKLCGYKPDNEIVERFLEGISEGYTVQAKKGIRVSPQVLSDQAFRPPSEKYTGKSIVVFAFRGKEYPVSSWKGMLMKIIDLMLYVHREQFSRVLKLRGRKRPYFSKNPNELRKPERINNTDIYVETNLSANSIVKISKKIIALFGYGESDIHIEAK